MTSVVVHAQHQTLQNWGPPNGYSGSAHIDVAREGVADMQINYSPLFEPRRGVIPLRCKVISRRSVCRLVNAGWVVTSARVFRFRGYCLVAYKENNRCS